VYLVAEFELSSRHRGRIQIVGPRKTEH
jgi:hypothetical protein